MAHILLIMCAMMMGCDHKINERATAAIESALKTLGVDDSTGYKIDRIYNLENEPVTSLLPNGNLITNRIDLSRQSTRLTLFCDEPFRYCKYIMMHNEVRKKTVWLPRQTETSIGDSILRGVAVVLTLGLASCGREPERLEPVEVEESDILLDAAGFFEVEAKDDNLELEDKTVDKSEEDIETKNYEDEEVEEPRCFDFTYGGYESDGLGNFIITKDGGYLLAGYTASEENGSFDGWMLKLDKEGRVEWEDVFATKDYERLYSVVEAYDGGYKAAGFKAGDGWMVKVDEAGNFEWEITKGTDGGDNFKVIKSIGGGKYLLAGDFNEGYIPGTPATPPPLEYYSSPVFYKFGGQGASLWSGGLYYNHDEFDKVFSAHATADGGIVAGGMSANNESNNDATFIVKFDAENEIEWEHILNDPLGNGARKIEQTSDGGYIAVGYSDYVTDGKSRQDGWLLKLDAGGGLEWSQTYRDAQDSVEKDKVDDYLYSVIHNKNDGYVMVGRKFYKYGGGNNTAWVVKVDEQGDIVWEVLSGEPGFNAEALQQDKDGDFVIGGHIMSKYESKSDVWLFKLDQDGNLICK